MKEEKQEKTLTPVQARHKRENAMLRMYLISLISLILCCTMLFGTTMAWFTSDVTSGTNVLMTGELQAQLLHVVPTVSAAESSGAETTYDLAENVEHQPFGTMALAPTYSTEALFRVNNLGDLPFAYQVYLNMYVEENQTAFGGQNQPAAVAETEEKQTPEISKEELAGYFNVYVGSKDDLEFVGTMQDLMKITAGERAVLYEGELYPESVVRDGNMLNASEEFIVLIELDEDATAEIMGMKLMFNIQLVANQLMADRVSDVEVQSQN